MRVDCEKTQEPQRLTGTDGGGYLVVAIDEVVANNPVAGTLGDDLFSSLVFRKAPTRPDLKIRESDCRWPPSIKELRLEVSDAFIIEVILQRNDELEMRRFVTNRDEPGFAKVERSRPELFIPGRLLATMLRLLEAVDG